jgi:hypothetical protein
MYSGNSMAFHANPWSFVAFFAGALIQKRADARKLFVVITFNVRLHADFNCL